MKWLFLVAMLQVGPGAGKAGQPDAFSVATDMGTVVGLARHCNLDPTLIEEYLVAAQARINAEADSSSERVMARIQLENLASVHEAKGPEEDCETFRQEFQRRLRALR